MPNASRPRALLPCLLLALLVLAAGAGLVRAESAGPYVHGALREDDEKLVVCLDRNVAVTVAESVNQAMLPLREQIAAADAASRQVLYERELYPSDGWQRLMDAVYKGDCDLVDSIDHISTRTILAGPEALADLGIAHSVVESRMLYGRTRIPMNVWIVTTEAVPPVGE